MLAVKSGKVFVVYAGDKTFVVDSGLAPYFPFPNEGELIDLEAESSQILIPAIEKAKRIGIFLGVKELVFPSGEKFQIGTTGKSFPVDINFYLEFLPNFAERVRRKILSGSPSQEKKTPTLFSW